MREFPILFMISLLVVASPAVAEEPVIGGPCEGCSLVFVGQPGNIDSSTRLVPEDEPGEPLVIEGTVTNLDGAIAEGILVYAYHTDESGIYPEAETRHGRIRGWARTDERGHYQFETIRPASYPNTRIEQHVHLHIIEPGCCTYYISSIHFDDDPFLSDADRLGAEGGRGGSGLVHPERGENGVWHVRRDIVLGLNVPGYPGS